MATEQDHTCGIDCKLSVSLTGGVAHMMYPADPNRDAGRYQASQNVGMTRREFRASGQDESRNVREWNYRRHNRVLSGQVFPSRSNAAEMIGGWPFIAHDIRMGLKADADANVPN